MKSNINIVIEKNRKKVKEINVAVENMQFANYKQILLKAQKETSDILAQLVEDERAAYEGDDTSFGDSENEDEDDDDDEDVSTNKRKLSDADQCVKSSKAK